MTSKNRMVLAICLVSLISISSMAQHKHSTQKKTETSGTDMASMMQSPHHKLMMAYVKSMSAFATALQEQSMKVEGFDVEAARSTVAELRHNLDAMDALHEKHMQSMNPDMESKMQTMMKNMDQHRAMVKDQVSALENDVKADKPNITELRNHATALVKHLQMMSNMHGGTMMPGMKMDMKKM
jgi:hypothetical protein